MHRYEVWMQTGNESVGEHMPRVHHVKKARKDYPEYGIKKGDSYYHWKFRYGGLHRSKTPPKASQLTQSEFLSRLYDVQDRIGDLSPDSAEDLETEVESIKEELQEMADECQEKRDNMPEGLQDGDVGQLLENRAEALESAIGDFDGIDFSIDEDSIREDATEDAKNEFEGEKTSKQELDDRIEELFQEKKEERLQEIIDEIQGISIDTE